MMGKRVRRSEQALLEEHDIAQTTWQDEKLSFKWRKKKHEISFPLALDECRKIDHQSSSPWIIRAIQFAFGENVDFPPPRKHVSCARRAGWCRMTQHKIKDCAIIHQWYSKIHRISYFNAGINLWYSWLFFVVAASPSRWGLCGICEIYSAYHFYIISLSLRAAHFEVRTKYVFM